ncbi:MAG: hypothetical protein M3O86_03235 [Actinomycetota bacterium]|nr:hypothetical protein [Actinomycetota bacterium]
MKAQEQWYSQRLEQHIGLARWGTWGAPVLVYPTAGGDAEEIERHGLVDACEPLLAAGRVKLYSCDSVAGRAMLAKTGSAEYRIGLLDAFHHCVRSEIVPAIRADCGGHELPVITAGASIGAFNAVATLCRFPDVIAAAIGMSGTYDLQGLFDGAWHDALYFASPLHFVRGLDGTHLDRLRQRFAILASGEGAWEDVGESWRLAEVLGGKGVPNRVDSWGPDWDHQWPTWQRMLPQYLDELTQ